MNSRAERESSFFFSLENRSALSLFPPYIRLQPFHNSTNDISFQEVSFNYDSYHLESRDGFGSGFII